MELVSKYIRKNSSGRKNPISGREIAGAFGVSGFEVRKLVNDARRNGDPICSTNKGYYISVDKTEISEQIASMRGRIAVMEGAISGLEKYLRKVSR